MSDINIDDKDLLELTDDEIIQLLDKTHPAYEYLQDLIFVEMKLDTKESDDDVCQTI